MNKNKELSDITRQINENLTNAIQSNFVSNQTIIQLQHEIMTLKAYMNQNQTEPSVDYRIPSAKSNVIHQKQVLNTIQIPPSLNMASPASIPPVN